MQRVISTGLRRAYSSSGRNLAEAASKAAPTALVLNFCTPHQPIHKKKAITQVVVPGASGEYGITLGHSALISQLQAGVVAVTHVDGAVEKYFVPGGFAVTQADSHTDISVPEAIPLADIDEALVRSSLAEAVKMVASSADNSVAKATAQIEVDTLQAMARAVGMTV